MLIAPGVELAGPFPGDLQQDLVFVGAVASDSKNARRQGFPRLSQDAGGRERVQVEGRDGRVSVQVASDLRLLGKFPRNIFH